MLYPIFTNVPDHQVTGRCIYPLSDLLTIALLTYICDGEDYTDMSDFAATHARDFGLLADCGDHSPSPDTFERLMASVDPEALQECLVARGRQFLDSVAEKQVVNIAQDILDKKAHYFLAVKENQGDSMKWSWMRFAITYHSMKRHRWMQTTDA